MLISLRKPMAEIAQERVVKSRQVSNRLFEVMGKLRTIDEAIDSAVTGDPDKFQDLQSSIERLESMLDMLEMRITSVRESNLLPLCKKTINIMDCATVEDLLAIDTEKLQTDWGAVYGAFLALDNTRQENDDKLQSSVMHMEDSAAEEAAVPNKVGTKGFVIAELPLVFTTDKSISTRLREFPENFHASQYAGGYTLQNQIVIGINAEGKGKRAISRYIELVIAAYKAKGVALVNVLDNGISPSIMRHSAGQGLDLPSSGRLQPYFWRRGNPLAFAWLMPISIYSKIPLRVRNVEINVKGDVSPVVSKPVNNDEQLKKLKQTRELFEAFLANDKTYNDFLKKAEIDKAFGDATAARKSKAQATARRLSLLAQWRDGSDAESLPDVAIPKTPTVRSAARMFAEKQPYRLVSTTTLRRKFR